MTRKAVRFTMLSTPRSFRALLLTVAGLFLLAAAPGLSPTLAAAPALTTPQMSVTWSTVHRACLLKQRGTREIRRCGERDTRARGHALRLRWHQHGMVRGRLTVADVPIPNAAVTVHESIRHRDARTFTLTTNTAGWFSAVIPGPSENVTVSYTTTAGTVLSASRRVYARAYLSLHIGRLKAGNRARFYGRVAGGYEPQDLYIQFWYYAGPRNGYLPFSHLALVNHKTGRWSLKVLIPSTTKGYRYRIHATVVPSPHWPWASTRSHTVIRRVS